MLSIGYGEGSFANLRNRGDLYIDKTQYTVRIARYTVHGTKCTAAVENNRTLEKFTVSIHEAKFYYSVFHKLK